MPLKYFICPDKVKIEPSACLSEGGCRMGERCATRAYLHLVSSDRPWKGKPSTTQLIQGTLCAFLKLTKEYSVCPSDRAFMVTGTKGHANLESENDECSLLEYRFDGEEETETGISDVIEMEKGNNSLIDYKLWGSYKVAKALGFAVVDRTTGETYLRGKRKGEPKTRKELIRDETKIDLWDVKLQLNNYRMKAEKQGIKIHNLKVQAIVRDGNTYIARSRGVFRNVYLFNVPIMADLEVGAYFAEKRNNLLTALKQGYWKEICDAKENWDGVKCSKYCEVAEWCSFGKYLKHEKESEDMAIKGLSEVRRLPRLGKIRLGIKKKTASGVEYPAEIDYFKLDPKTPSEEENKKLVEEFEKLYGKEPKQIKIMFPLADTGIFFPQFYKRYANGVLRCKGDGETAGCISKEFASDLVITGDNEMGGVNVLCKGQDCPYYKAKKCSESAALSILLPEMPGAGVWEIVTGSFHSIVNINSCLDYIRAVCGRVHMIPLTLERRSTDIMYEGKKSKHFILHINMAFKLIDLQRMALIDPTKSMLELPAPESDKEDILFQENPEVNPPANGILLINEKQEADLIALLKEQKDFGQNVFAAWLKETHGAETIQDIPASVFVSVIETIQKRTEEILKFKK